MEQEKGNWECGWEGCNCQVVTEVTFEFSEPVGHQQESGACAEGPEEGLEGG